MKYGTLEGLKNELLHKRIIEWNEDKLVLEDGMKITIEMSESDCCAYAGGTFKNVKLDAAITNVEIIPDVKRSGCVDYETTNYAQVVVYHNQNLIAQADCTADDGNCGYYYSVCALKVKDVFYQVVSA